MKIEKLRGKSTQEILSRLTREFGPEAVILETKSLPKGPDDLWEGPHRFEVTVGYEPGSEPAEVGLGATQEPIPRPSESSGHIDLVELPRPLRYCYLCLLEHGMERSLVERLTRLVLEKRGREGVEAMNHTRCREALKAEVADMASRHLWQPQDVQAPRKVVVVGPTGSGKTTMLLKMAIRSTLGEGCEPALINTDSRRVTSTEDLEVIGSVLGIPVEAAFTPEELESCLRTKAKRDPIFIDTGGVTGRNVEPAARLREIVGVASPCEVHLILPASLRLEVAKRTSKSLGNLPLSSIAVSKLDEYQEGGALLSLMQNVTLPLSYASWDADVTSEVTLLTAERLADLALSHCGPGSRGAGYCGA